MTTRPRPLAASILAAALPLLAARAAEWPQFHGPRRDNRSTETGLLGQWPPEGPKLLWTAKGTGHGFATVAIAGGRIYTTGNIGPHTVITALDLDGKPLWTAPNGPADRHDRPGTRSTPTLDGTRLYHEGSTGDLACLDAATGKPIWTLNILKKFAGRDTKWGLSESPLIDGNRLICVPGGVNAGIVALDKATGNTVWVCADTTEKPGYASPIAIDFGGIRQIVTMMQSSVVGVRADNGKLLWRQPHTAFADETVATPLFHAPHIFVSTLFPGGSQLIELTAQANGIAARRVWQSIALCNHHGSVVLVDGHLYGSTARGKWECVQFATGKITYSDRGIGKGSLTYADGHLYAYSENGRHVALIKPAPESHHIVSRFRIPAGGRGPTWAHPVVCGARLYLRHSDFLYCYDIKAK